jgi:hypothetical protein
MNFIRAITPFVFTTPLLRLGTLAVRNRKYGFTPATGCRQEKTNRSIDDLLKLTGHPERYRTP